jgi:hypothetical protein
VKAMKEQSANQVYCVAWSSGASPDKEYIPLQPDEGYESAKGSDGRDIISYSRNLTTSPSS